MVYVKAAIVTTLVLICALLAFMFYTFDADYQLNSAMEAYLRDEFSDSKQMLAGLDGVVKPSQLNLSRAYIARAEGRLDESDRYLELASQHVRRGNTSRTLEIILNHTLNAALQQDLGALKEQLTLAEEIDANNSYVRLFRGLSSYLDRDYPAALAWWEQDEELEPLSGWMKKGFSRVGAPSWKAIRVAHSQIATGKVLPARRLLEEETQTFGREDLLDAWFLIGLSHLKEAENRPLAAAVSYYKRALGFFDRVPVQHDRFAHEKQEAIELLYGIAQELASSGMWEDLATITQAMVNWNAEKEVKQLSNSVLTIAETELSNGEWDKVKEILTLLSRMLPGNQYHAPLLERLQVMIKEELAKGDTSALPDYWEMARQLSDEPVVLASEYSEWLQEEILALLPDDNEQLQAISSRLFLWDLVERGSGRRLELAGTLADYAGSIWLNGAEEQKAFRLMQVAAGIPFMTEQKAFHQNVERVLRVLYKSAVKKDEVERLTGIFDTARYFHIDPDDLQDKNETANLIADAQYLIKQRRLDEAEKRLDLVLAIDRHNVEGLRLEGLVQFKREEMAEALKLLKPLPNLDREAKEALAVAEIVAGDRYLGMHLLSRLEEEKAIGAEANLLLAYGVLRRGDGVMAENRLKMIQEPESGTDAALCYAAFLREDWQLTATRFRNLSAPFNQLTGLQLAAVQSFSEIGRPELAENILQQTLAGKSHGLVEFTSPFAEFKEEVLDAWNPQLVAGVFYAEVKQDYKTAMKHLEKVQEESPQLLAVRGRALAELGRYDEALADFQQLQESEDTALKAQGQKAAGLLFAELGWDHNALEAFSLYSQMNAGDAEVIAASARVWARRDRWDQTLKQLHALQKVKDLDADEKVFLTETMFRTERFAEVEKLLKTWLADDSQMDLEHQIRLATIAERLDKENLVERVLGSLDQAKLTEGERVALLEFYVEKGDYRAAQKVMPELSSEARDTAETKLVMAELHDRLSNEQEALALVRSLSGPVKGHAEAWTYSYKTDHDLEVLKARLAETEELMGKYPTELTLNLAFARDSLHLANARNSAKRGTDRDYEGSLEKVRARLQQIHESSKSYPETYYLLGQVLHLQGNLKGAEDAYLYALKLAPSSTSLRVDLSALYSGQTRGDEALGQLTEALKYAPRSPRVWQAMANLYQDTGDLLQAKQCYQTVVALRPNDSVAYFVLGKLLLELQNPEDARPLLSRGVQLSPRSADGLELLLECLYDKSFNVGNRYDETIITEREETLEKLQNVNPERALRTLQRLNSSSIQ